LLGVDISGATLGILGYGRIGQALARRATGFDMRILYHDPSLSGPDPAALGEPVDFETLLRRSDFISLHTPLTAQTYHLIDDRALALMKPSAVLINTARGPVVDPQALYQALKERRIFAAALDVTEPEPIPMDSPLLELENLVIVPHIASASRATREKMATMAAENLIAGLKGERLPNCANPEVYLSA
jgi:glyoxylate reductase